MQREPADILFVSDLHLCEDRPEKLVLFRKFLEGPARHARALYILGDLFEHFWLGNEDPTPPAPAVLSLLAEFTGQGENSTC